MTFVFPLLLGGLALISVPVLIHLIMRQKPKTLDFPAFRFLLQKHRTNLRKLRLRHLLLLVLRVLLIAAICLAVARPKFFGSQLNLSADRPVAAVLVFDTSPSMEYKITGDQSRLDDAKKRGLELLDELPEGSRVAILDTAENTPSGKGVWLVNMHEARQRIGGLRLRYANSPVTTRLENAYRLLAALAHNREDDAGRSLPRLLCVLSDRTRACWDVGNVSALHDLCDQVPPPLERLQRLRNSTPALVELLQQFPKEVPPLPGQGNPDTELIVLWEQLREQVPSLAPDEYPDQATATLLHKLRAKNREMIAVLKQLEERLSAEAKEYHAKLLSTLETRLQELSGIHQIFIDVGVDNPVNLGIADVELPLESGGRRQRQVFDKTEKVLLRVVVQSAGEAENTVICQVAGKTMTQAVAPKPGQRQVVPFEIDCGGLAPGAQQVEIRFASGDRLAFDNTRFVTFAIREPRPVLILTDDAETAKGWKEAIESREEARFRCTIRPVGTVGDLVPAELAQYQAVYLFNVAKPAPKLWESLRAYVQSGGGLAVVPPGKIEDKAYDSKEAQALLPGKLLKTLTQKDPGPAWDWAETGIYQHPLLKPVGEWKNLGLDFLEQPRTATIYWEAAKNDHGEVLVHYAAAKKLPALLERQFGGKEGRRGRVLLFTTRLDSGQEPRWNNYMERVTSFCVVLPGLTTGYLAGDTAPMQMNFLSGQGVPTVLLPLAGRAPAYTLQGPGVLETVPVGEGQGVLTLRQAGVPGNYVVGDGGRLQVGAFSVNVPPEECLLERVPVAEIEALLGPGAVVPVGQRTALGDALQGHWDQPLELLPLLLLLLLVLLALENLLGNLFYRREPEPQT